MPLFAQVKGRRLYDIVKLVGGLTFAMYGYDAGYLGGLLTHDPFLELLGHPENDTWTIPFISSSYTLAALVTAFILIFCSWSLGRRGVILMGCAFCVAGAIVQATTYSVAQLIVGRVLTGVGIGCISTACPTYVAESGAENGDRGIAVSIQAVCLISGVPIALWITYGTTKSDGAWSYRFPIAFQCIFAIVAGILMIFLPDTPRYYYVKGNEAKGDETLCRLYDKPIDDPQVQFTKREILQAIEAETAANAKLRWTQFLTFGVIDRSEFQITRRLWYCFWITFLREWCGINLIIYYSTVLFVNVGIEDNLVTLLAAILATIFAIGTLPLLFTINVFPRKQIMGWGALGLFLTLLPFTVLIGIDNQTSATRWTAVGFIFAFVLIFGYSWQGIIWLVSVEIAPLEYRHIGMSMAAIGEWSSSFWTVFAGQIGVNVIGYRMYIVILVGQILSIAFIYFCIPETSNRSLEEIDLLFFKGSAEDHARSLEAARKAQEKRLEDVNAGVKTEERDV